MGNETLAPRRRTSLLTVALILALLAVLTVKGLSYSGQIEGPLFRGVFQGQLMVGF